MIVHVESLLDCRPEDAWAEVQTSRLLVEVARPIIRFQPVEPAEFPERWPVGQTLFVRSKLFGLIPLGRRSLRFERIDPVAREISTRESDPLVRRWDHVIGVRESAYGRTIYSDTIDIEAGVLTPLVAAFAQVFYRHRQRRWKNVAERLRSRRAAEVNAV